MMQWCLIVCTVTSLMAGCSSIQQEQPASSVPADRPNILFCIADDASYPHMGAYGTDWINTPAFDRVAEEGILFTRTYTSNAKCAPSRASILTGRNSWQLEEAANHWCYFPEKFKTYTETLMEHDYHVGYVAKGWAPGVALDADGNKRLMTGKPYNDKKTTPPAKHINGNDYAENFRAFLNDKPEDQPFCFWYGSTEPHRRYEYGAGVAKAGKTLGEIDEVPSVWPDNEIIRNDMLDYAFEIEYFDQHLQQMLDILEETGQLDNTIIIVTADNGMPFPRIKGEAYEYSNHLPLAVMWKDGINNPGRRVDDYVSFIDFAPTFLELAQVDGEIAGMQPMEGRSFTNILYSDKAGTVDYTRDHVLIGKERHATGRPKDVGYPIRGIVKDNYLYVRNFEINRWPICNPETGYLNSDGSPTKTWILDARRSGENVEFWQWSFGKRPVEELYNVVDDPDCLDNLADMPEFLTLKQARWTQLEAELKAQQDPRMFGNGHIFDEYKYANESGYRFYEKYMAGEETKSGWVNDTDFEKEPLP
jgi:N-sulfoglucosamine sulfohydrolase